MPFIPSDSGITVVATGSIGFAFRNDGETLPSVITITATDSELDVTTFADLSLITEASAQWQAVELTTPLAYGEVYDVDVLFDGVSVYTQSVEVP